jgi:hypothetical protein
MEFGVFRHVSPPCRLLPLPAALTFTPPVPVVEFTYSARGFRSLSDALQTGIYIDGLTSISIV